MEREDQERDAQEWKLGGNIAVAMVPKSVMEATAGTLGGSSSRGSNMGRYRGRGSGLVIHMIA